ncbi:MAG: hypothetical protein AAGB12_11225 [Pseudomonadota bacterium]
MSIIQLKQKVRFVACSFALLVSFSTAAETEKSWNKYEKVAQSLLGEIKQSPLPSIQKKGNQLVDLAKEILPDFTAKNPQCKEYIQAALKASNRMLDLTLDEIEKDYHADGKLPAMKNVSCYHAKDLLVHPATVVVIAKRLKDEPKTRLQLKAEIDEVLEHFSQVKKSAGL